ALPAVLNTFGDHLSTRALRQLHLLGVEVELNTKVVNVDRTGIEVESERGHQRIPSMTKVWAAGVAAPPLARKLAEATGAKIDRAGRIFVQPDLTVPGHPEIFAIGDTIVIAGPDGNPIPGIAPAAKQQGRYVADSIKARLRGETPAPFRYKHAGSLAQIGKRKAVIDFGSIKLRGALAWWIWGIAHIYFLIGLRNRLSVALTWLWVYARDQRAARLITQGSSKVGR
ncbi:MAG TPA: FAD-dependent oxidoreductase, partial [Bradyrhizobium sp.]|uniref:NAD(P)/FAD-dependent oxidoreductase n=1 Tax=Bradyrhizobium sp. TaxID=376 RepID=UPI002B4990E4